ncbi:uncharacterized protein LOC132390363 [Hypanus sabinus]|uniref:uncharacterized protein LOC132390363 n=1 Tax=Hypanus sabinus TaxID=79690 RepID=UPI0028C3EF1E|nr:uncharacterized protein LOC132390363 [Hypanus sabinus]
MLEAFFRVRKIYYMIIAVIGAPVNLAAIVILTRGNCGLSICTTRYLVAMATADLLTIIFRVILWRISYYYFPGTFLDITPVCSAIAALGLAATDCSVWFTVTFTFDRFVAICCQKRKITYCTGETAAVVLTAIGVLFCFNNVPYFFIYHPAKVVENIPWDCITKPSYYTDPGWVGYDWLTTVLSPLLPIRLSSVNTDQSNDLQHRFFLATERKPRTLRKYFLQKEILTKGTNLEGLSGDYVQSFRFVPCRGEVEVTVLREIGLTEIIDIIWPPSSSRIIYGIRAEKRKHIAERLIANDFKTIFSDGAQQLKTSISKCSAAASGAR